MQIQGREKILGISVLSCVGIFIIFEKYSTIATSGISECKFLPPSVHLYQAPLG